MIGAFPVGSASVSSTVATYDIGSIDPETPVLVILPRSVFPINSGPIAIFGLPKYPVPIVGPAGIFGQRRKLGIDKITRIPKVTVGSTISIVNGTLILSLTIGSQINRIPININSLSIQRLIIRATRGYTKTNMIPRTLDDMQNTNEAIWLLKLYELAVQELRTHSMPTEKAGALKISTPTLYAQALAMGDDVI